MNGIEELIKSLKPGPRCTACGRVSLPAANASKPFPLNVVMCRTCGHSMVNVGNAHRDLTRDEAAAITGDKLFDVWIRRRNKRIKHLFG